MVVKFGEVWGAKSHMKFYLLSPGQYQNSRRVEVMNDDSDLILDVKKR